ncbi:hypothetical protein [Burkholderia cepacia]|uniref:hypothetical protein n=1 Tax=Burkholderia cepacia TaxID=292 RepID=UPI00398E9E24
MLEFLVSLVAGAMAEHFQQKRVPVLRMFVLTFIVFTLAFAIGLPLTAPLAAREKGALYVTLISIAAGTILGLLMVIVLILFRRKHKTKSHNP